MVHAKHAHDVALLSPVHGALPALIVGLKDCGLASVFGEGEVCVPPVIVDMGWTEIPFARDAVAVVARGLKAFGLGTSSCRATLMNEGAAP